MPPIWVGFGSKILETRVPFSAYCPLSIVLCNSAYCPLQSMGGFPENGKKLSKLVNVGDNSTKIGNFSCK